MKLNIRRDENNQRDCVPDKHVRDEECTEQKRSSERVETRF